ncbi:MAG: S9 family peptidase, partial [Chloroflexi bacterium]|nr:S9 family peptidase [Chloroflexota bacterium]
LTYASRITTPMLIIHSEQDLRCPIEQAEQLHVALLLAGKVSRFVRFANADHELSRTGRPRQRLERFRHILDWFEPYLRPKGR